MNCKHAHFQSPSARIGVAALLLAILGAACLRATPQTPATPAGKQVARLPGTRPEILAADYPSLQAALDAVPAEGGLVVLPPGVFEITQPLVLRRGETQLRGAGAATQIVNRNTAGEPALVIQHPQGKQAPKEERLWRVMLSDFRITGNPQSGHGVLAVQIEEIFIQGLTVSHHGGDGVRLDFCYEDPRVSDCLLTYNRGVGLNLIGCHDIVVSANQFEENQDGVHCFDGFNLCLTGNCLDDHLGHGVVIENTYGSVVAGNMIEECQGAALIMDRDCYGNTVSANVIAHNGQGVLLKDAHGCSVSANTFTIMKQDAVLLTPQSGRITITGNNFCDSEVGEGLKRAENDRLAAGVKLGGASDVSLTGNVFAGVGPKAYQSNGARRVAVTGNVMVDAPLDDSTPTQSVESANVR